MLTRVIIKHAASFEDKVEKSCCSILQGFALSGSPQTFNNPDLDYYKHTINDGISSRILALAFVGDQPVGASTLNMHIKEPDHYERGREKDNDGVRSLYISLFTILPEFRRANIGTELFEAISEYSGITKNDFVHVVWPSDNRAKSFWMSLGCESVPYPTFGRDLRRASPPGYTSPLLDQVEKDFHLQK